MEKKLAVVAIIISLVACGLSGFGIYKATATPDNDKEEVQYVMYLGTNDKDTNDPVFSEEDAKSHADAILAENFDGFTIEEARGGWKNDDGSIAHEYTLVIILSDTTSEKVHKAADELIKEFNQNSVMIQENTLSTEFYEGE